MKNILWSYNEKGADKLIQLNNLKKKKNKLKPWEKDFFFQQLVAFFFFAMKLKLFFSCQLIVFPVNH